MGGDFYESSEWLDLRYKVLQKSNGSCKLCGCRASPGNPVQVDHIKPRSTHPRLALSEANLQVLCRACNMGKSNKDTTDWSLRASNNLQARIKRQQAVLAYATALQRGKLEQLSWLRQNDVDDQIKKEAERQYQALWKNIESEWIAAGEPR